MISKLPRWVWSGAAVLSFSAGMVNAIAFLGFAHKAATHVTGLFSLFSISAEAGDAETAREALCILGSFFAGAVLSGIIIRDGHLKMGRRYGFALVVESALLFFSAWGFYRLSPWGEYFAAMSAGLQNAMASTYSGTIVRTTHLTGILTDFGALIGNRLHGAAVDGRRLKLLAIILASFTAGGFAGAAGYHRWAALAMLVPSAIIGASAVGYEIFRRAGEGK